jgi:hypothetical protein
VEQRTPVPMRKLPENPQKSQKAPVKPPEVRVRGEEDPNSADLTPKLQKTPTATHSGTCAWQSLAAATAAGKSRTTTENPPEKHEHVGEDPSTVDLLPKEQKNPSTIHNGATAIYKTTYKTGAGRQSSGETREHRKNPTTVELHPRRRETPS